MTPYPFMPDKACDCHVHVYDPAQERRLRLRLPAFEAATVASGHGWTHLDLTDAFADWLGAHRRRDAYFREPELATFALGAFADHLAIRLRAALDNAAWPLAQPGPSPAATCWAR